MATHRNRDRSGVPDRSATIRGRLVRILALPLVAIVALLGVVAAGELGNYRAAKTTAESVALALAVQNLVQELQLERGLTSGWLGGNAGFRNEIGPERQAVDAQRTEVARLAHDNTSTGVTAVRTALDQLGGLDAIRAEIDAGSAKRADTFQYFTDRIAALRTIDFGLHHSLDTTLRSNASAFEALSDLQEETSKERAFLNGVFSAGGFGAKEYSQFAAIDAAQRNALDRFMHDATPAQRARHQVVMRSGAASVAAYFEQVADGAADGRLMQVNPQSWWSALTTVLGGTREVQQMVGSDIQRRASDLQGTATRRLAGLLALVLLCVGGAVALVISAARSIAGPLAALAAEADSVASVRLPEAVEQIQAGSEEKPAPPQRIRVSARASTEIHSVADALDRLQATAYTLASEQARLRRNTTESLANLGRRNQNLLRRQLGFITMLERKEVDPTGLANLFELDHLATRMRRNAESLLVLVGETGQRRSSSPMPVADVIRAAISEVEEYRRVSLRKVDDAYIAGSHVTSLAHMIAELVENGLAFSPPDLDLEIHGRQIGDGYLIAVVDQGVGMNADELAQANARLRGEETFLQVPARYLGHYVVGRLAQQMSVDVQIAPSPVTGVTARIQLPVHLLADPVTVRAETPALAGADRLPKTQRPAEIVAGPAKPPVIEYITVDASDHAFVGDSGAGSPDPAARTANGLRKRVPRERAQVVMPVAAEAMPDAVPDQSPTGVQKRLTTLRAAMRRGHGLAAETDVERTLPIVSDLHGSEA